MPTNSQEWWRVPPLKVYAHRGFYDKARLKPEPKPTLNYTLVAKHYNRISHIGRQKTPDQQGITDIRQEFFKALNLVRRMQFQLSISQGKLGTTQMLLAERGKELTKAKAEIKRLQALLGLEYEPTGDLE